MINTLATVVIIGLAAMEACCIDRLVGYAKECAEKKSEARRSEYRTVYYKAAEVQRKVRKNRESLWEEMTK